MILMASATTRVEERPVSSGIGPDQALYKAHVNPQWVRMLDLLQMNVQYVRCFGAELETSDGRSVLDFLSGYCVHNTGHNHPVVVDAVRDEVTRSGPAMLQSHVPDLAGTLAARLCRLAGSGLNKAFFCSSGSEGVEAAIKFSRVHTKRNGLLYADGAFHGLTCGALSLMGDSFWSERFGPMLPDTKQIPFGDIGALEARWPPGSMRRSLSSRCNPRPAFAFRQPVIFDARRSFCRRTERCWCSTKCKPGCTGRARSSPRTCSVSKPTW